MAAVSGGQRILVVAALGCAVVAVLAAYFGPHSSSNPYGVFLGVLGILGFGTLRLVSGYRKWRLYKAREDATDYRADPWAGTTNSA